MKKKIFLSLIIIVIISLVYFLSLKKNNLTDTPDSIYPASAETGNIAEKIIGNPDEANIVVYEYADYSCSHCATWNKVINDLIEKSNGKIALVFRSYDIGLKNNGSAAARAATAAQIQSYFKEYKDLLFSNQAEWSHEKDKNKLDELFVQYFREVSNNSGDVDKFKNDMESDAVIKRLAFETKLGKKANLRGTPMFRINGETIELNNLVETIENTIAIPLSE